jgi:hypothetical protein
MKELVCILKARQFKVFEIMLLDCDAYVKELSLFWSLWLYVVTVFCLLAEGVY